MKKLLLFVALAFASLMVNAQERPHKVYAELLGETNLMRTKVTISIDFGQEISFWQQHAQRQLVDAQGREMKFNSMVDAMNYMGTLGWEFEQAYVVTVGQQNVYHWLMSKIIDEEDAATEGINTRQNFIDSQETPPNDE
jgi:hypothetical protein